ncbi:MAG: Obg family GTPase CgtA, partial [Dehalococcoidales bacterium]|nr:Obg family GTPase CgtA [Dehalococcoidales bacterium]
FTTLEPIPGVVRQGQREFVIAEIPGLIEGAHLGKGLGHDFLRHIVRTRVLVHLIDGSSAAPVEDMLRINNELSLYDPDLARKPQIVAVNKIDIPGMEELLSDIREEFRNAGIDVLFISAETGKGIQALTDEILKLLETVGKSVPTGLKLPATVFRPQPVKTDVTVTREGDVYVLHAPALERYITGDDVSGYEIRRQLQKPMERYGVIELLEKAGIESGDTVRCGDYEWEW